MERQRKVCKWGDRDRQRDRQIAIKERDSEGQRKLKIETEINGQTEKSRETGRHRYIDTKKRGVAERNTDRDTFTEVVAV